MGEPFPSSRSICWGYGRFAPDDFDGDHVRGFGTAADAQGGPIVFQSVHEIVPSLSADR